MSAKLNATVQYIITRAVSKLEVMTPTGLEDKHEGHRWLTSWEHWTLHYSSHALPLKWNKYKMGFGFAINQPQTFLHSSNIKDEASPLITGFVSHVYEVHGTAVSARCRLQLWAFLSQLCSLIQWQEFCQCSHKLLEDVYAGKQTPLIFMSRSADTNRTSAWSSTTDGATLSSFSLTSHSQF